jgi:hypothetical protein
MRVIIPEDRIKKLVYKYLDNKFKDSEQVKGYNYDIIIKIPDEKFPIIGWDNNGHIAILENFTDSLLGYIPIEFYEMNEIIGEYIEDRYGLNVKDISSQWSNYVIN